MRRTEMKRLVLLLIALLLFALPVVAGADVIKIGECTDCEAGTTCEDNTLWAFAGDANCGADALVATGDYGGGDMNPIFRFDLSDILDGSDVTAVTLGFRVESADGGGVTVTCYQIADANNNWVEGTITAFASSQVGSSCWNKKAYNTTNWAVSAGLSNAGGDYINTSFGTAGCTTTGAKTISFNAAGIAAVEDRLADDDIELLFRASSYASNVWSDIYSSDTATTAYRPYLEVTYTPPAAGAAQIIPIRR
jgi:hypothetical protein